MYPRLLILEPLEVLGRSVGPFTLHTYGVLIVTSFLAGLWVTARQARQDGMDPARTMDLAVWVLISGMLGSKLFMLVVESPQYSLRPSGLLSIAQSGGVFYGGLIVGTMTAFWYARRHSLPAWRAADALGPAMAIGSAIGRLGCLAAGCCHGRPTDVPWAVSFSDPYSALHQETPLNTPLHPTQLYESLATLAMFAFLLALSKRKRFEGQVILTYFAAYSVARFLIEFFRGDAARGTIFEGALSTSQLVAVLALAAVMVVTPYVRKRRRICCR